MSRRLAVGCAVVAAWTTMAFGQASDTPYQVRAVANLKPHDSIVVSNSGASSTQASPQNGALCANIYALSASTGLLVDCCTCLVGANALASISIVGDILAKPKKAPKAVVLKLMGTLATNETCDASTVGGAGNVLATGLLAWKDQIPFTPATLSAAELAHLTAECGAKHAGGNICPICQPQ